MWWFGMQVQSGINREGDHPSGALVPVTAVTFEAPRVGTPSSLATPHTLQLQTGQSKAHLLMPLLLEDRDWPGRDAPTLLHSMSSVARGLFFVAVVLVFWGDTACMLHGIWQRVQRM